MKNLILAAVLVALSPGQPWCPPGAVCGYCHGGYNVVFNNSESAIYLDFKDGCVRLSGVKGGALILLMPNQKFELEPREEKR